MLSVIGDDVFQDAFMSPIFPNPKDHGDASEMFRWMGTMGLAFSVTKALLTGCTIFGGCVFFCGIRDSFFSYEVFVRVLEFLTPLEVPMDLTFDGSPVLCKDWVPVPKHLAIVDKGSDFWYIVKKRFSIVKVADGGVRTHGGVHCASDICVEDTDFHRLWRSRPLKRVAQFRYRFILYLSRYFPVEIYRIIIQYLGWSVVPSRKIRRPMRAPVKILKVSNMTTEMRWVSGKNSDFVLRANGTACSIVHSMSTYDQGSPTAITMLDVPRDVDPMWKRSDRDEYLEYNAALQ